MEINLMTLEQIEERTAEIEQLLEKEDTDLDSVKAETEQLKTRKAELIAERKAILEEVSQIPDDETTIIERGEKPMEKTLVEVLKSAEYEEAYARYIKTEDATEVRSLLSEMVDSGTVPVPTYLNERIMTAWDNSELFGRVNKSYIKGIIRQGFELSATGAAKHVEGDMDHLPSEEELTIGVVEIKPVSLKKWISISDEVMDMTGRAFLDYIYDEIEYRIVKLAEEEAIKIIKSLSTASASAVSVKNYSGEPAANLCIMAEALLTDEARNPVFIANKQTIAQFKSLMTADGYLINNPFNNMPTIAQNSLPSYETASAGAVYAIIGDLSAFRANFPNGTEVKFKFDDLSLAEKDLIKIVGRMYVGMNVVACDRFVLVKKPVVSG